MVQSKEQCLSFSAFDADSDIALVIVMIGDYSLDKERHDVLQNNPEPFLKILMSVNKCQLSC